MGNNLCKSQRQQNKPESQKPNKQADERANERTKDEKNGFESIRNLCWEHFSCHQIKMNCYSFRGIIRPFRIFGWFEKENVWSLKRNHYIFFPFHVSKFRISKRCVSWSENNNKIRRHVTTVKTEGYKITTTSKNERKKDTIKQKNITESFDRHSCYETTSVRASFFVLRNNVTYDRSRIHWNLSK